MMDRKTPRRTNTGSLTQSRLVRATPAIISFLLNLFSATAAYQPMLAHVDPRVKTALETPTIAAIIDLHSQLAVVFVTLFTLLATTLLVMNRREESSTLPSFRVVVICVTLIAILWLFFAGGARTISLDLYLPPPDEPPGGFHIPPLASPITWVRAIAFLISAIYAALELRLFSGRKSGDTETQRPGAQAHVSGNAGEGDDDSEQ